MKFADHLDKESIMKFNQLKFELREQKSDVDVEVLGQPVKPIKENLSRREWEDLMGKNMDIYTRRRGAVRRK